MTAIKRIKVQFILREDRTDEKGDAPIYLRLTSDKKRVLLSAEKKISTKRWNSKEQKVIGKDKLSEGINQYLEQIKAKVQEAINQLYIEKKPISLLAVKNLLALDNSTKVTTLLGAAKMHNEEMHSLIGRKFSFGNFKNYKTTYKHLEAFLKDEFRCNDLPLTEVNLSFAHKFEKWLLLKTQSNNNGAMKHLQRLKKILNRSIQMGFIEKHQLHGFHISFEKHERGYLSPYEIELIERSSFSAKCLNLVRDVFLFQIYTGLAYTDVKSLSWEHVVYNVENRDWIIKSRDKTNIRSMIPLLTRAKQILEKQEQNEGEPIFKVYANQVMNRHLKKIAEELSISKRLTTHIARHSFATTITLNNGIPIETVSKMLGHTKISTTQIYSKVTTGKISRDMDKLQNLF